MHSTDFNNFPSCGFKDRARSVDHNVAPSCCFKHPDCSTMSMFGPVSSRILIVVLH